MPSTPSKKNASKHAHRGRLGLVLGLGLLALAVAGTVISAATSYRVNSGQTVTVNEHSTCQQVINSSGVDYFIPTNSATEWEAFRNNSPSGVSLSACFTCGSSTVTHEGYTYSTVQIGSQCWLGENIKHGTMLASAGTMPSNNGTVQKWCYSNNSALCESEGGLYHWNEAMMYSTTAGAQGICPAGWHIPTDAELKILVESQASAGCESGTGWQCSPAGTSLKSGGNSGFDAILPGHRDTDSNYYSRGTFTLLWSSTESGASAWRRNLRSSYSTVYRDTRSKADGLSVRCLQD